MAPNLLNLRGRVCQYLGRTSAGAYLSLYLAFGCRHAESLFGAASTYDQRPSQA